MSASVLMTRRNLAVYVFFLIAVVLNVAFWFYSRPVKLAWGNVPPVPSHNGAVMMAFGDEQFAYRAFAVALQNFGDSGGRTIPLKDYNYDALGQWFFLEDKLDQRSNYIPMLAAFYFGGSQDAGKLDPVIDYLRVVGQRPYGEKWRWLMHAVFLARHKQQDLDKALELANLLAQTKDPDAPGIVKQMPALIMTEQGDKEGAYNLMMGILKSSAEKLHPNEVNYMRDYICNRVLAPEQARAHPLCEGL